MRGRRGESHENARIWALNTSETSFTFSLEKGKNSQLEDKCKYDTFLSPFLLPNLREGHTYQRGKDRGPPNSFSCTTNSQ